MANKRYKNIITRMAAVGVVTVGTVFATTGCTGKSTATTENADNIAAVFEYGMDETSAELTGLPNPIVEYKTLEEAEKAAGFDLNIPDKFGEYQQSSVSVISGYLLQVFYNDADGNEMLIRKAPGSDDISGDYSKYSEIQTAEINSHNVTLKGNGDAVCVATWTDDDYSYSVSASEAAAMSVSDISEIIESIH